MLITVKEALHQTDIVLRSVAEWLDGYVSQPDPNSTRAIPMCIRSRVAIDRGLILLAHRTQPTPTQTSYLSEIEQINNLYHNCRTGTAQLANYFSILFCYDAVDLELFEASCRTCKSSFLTRKLLLGKFHPEIRLHALDNAEHWFQPTPFPILALRRLIREDQRFLSRNRHVEDRGKLVEIYKNVFGN